MSNKEITSRTCCSTVRPSVAARPPRKARYCINILVVSVFPAPLSPLTSIELLFPSFIIPLQCFKKMIHSMIQMLENLSVFSFIHNYYEQNEHEPPPVSNIGDCKNMGAKLSERRSFVLLHHVGIVEMR